MSSVPPPVLRRTSPTASAFPPPLSPIYPPVNFIQPSPESNANGFGNGSQPINIPNASSKFTFPTPQQLPFPASYPPLNPSVSNGQQLPPQDIPWEKIRNTEDQRQLEAIYTTLRL